MMKKVVVELQVVLIIIRFYLLLNPLRMINLHNHNNSSNNYKKNINKMVDFCSLENQQIFIYSSLGTSDISNDAKLDDAYLKMKRLDKALEEAFEKEKQVKFETMSLIKKYVNKHIFSHEIIDDVVI